jgi:hypothetical protein
VAVLIPVIGVPHRNLDLTTSMPQIPFVMVVNELDASLGSFDHNYLYIYMQQHRNTNIRSLGSDCSKLFFAFLLQRYGSSSAPHHAALRQLRCEAHTSLLWNCVVFAFMGPSNQSMCKSSIPTLQAVTSATNKKNKYSQSLHCKFAARQALDAFEYHSE